MSQLKTNSIVPLNGLPAGATGGGILQCVQTTWQNNIVMSATGTFVQVPNLTVTITPSKSTNKILVMWALNTSTNNNQPGLALYRNGSVVSGASGLVASTRSMVSTGVPYIGLPYMTPVSGWYIDSPGATTAQTYSLYAMTGGSSALYINQSADDADGNSRLRGMSNIIAMEVSV